MAATTPIYGFPYQTPTDPPDGADLGHDLALSVETALDTVDDRLDIVETDLNTAEATILKPLVRMVQTVIQNLPDNTNTAITFTTEEIDTHGFHSTSSNTSRVTPNVAGYYRCTGVVYHSTNTAITARAAWFRKNGTTDLSPAVRKANVVNAVNTSLEVTCIVAMNGTTDYVELIAYQDNTSSSTLTTAIASQYASTFEMEFLRKL